MMRPEPEANEPRPERRRHTRKKTDLPVKCQAGEGTLAESWRGRTLDVSVGGLSLIAEAQVDAGRDVAISLQLPWSDGPAWDGGSGLPPSFVPIKGLARVVWSHPYAGKGSRVGLKFIELDAEARASLFAMLRGMPGED